MASTNGLALMMKPCGDLEDPAIGRAKRHELLDIIVITLCTVVCGAGSLNLPNGIPSQDTFVRAFSPFASEQLPACSAGGRSGSPKSTGSH